ncbi:YgjV family protein [Vibrio renipiscarius]|uniref:Membrane protein n=1 Tax=Vibrio renipiscarius TaxID=1461322 RepID=A0A0C2JFL1_9VIBR|nr:YgjV family protein [Vibrio renipiscarius]KII76709.1 membrane protein [Vibrio renipiscarius]KII77771.1 membrane protein [Vibrio renipiscarius]
MNGLLPEWDLAQAVGMFGFAIGTTAFLHRDGQRFRLHLMIFQFIMCGHFVMMDAMVAAFGSGISAIRSYSSTKTQSTGVMVFFIVMIWGMGLPQLDYLYELLPIIGSTVATLALFKFQGLPMRLLMLVSSCCWVINNLLMGSIGATLMEVIFIFVNLSTILRLYFAQSTSRA